LPWKDRAGRGDSASKCTSSEGEENNDVNNEEEEMDDEMESAKEDDRSDNKNTQDHAKTNEESSSEEKSNSEVYQMNTLQKISKYILRSGGRSDPFNVVSTANFSYLREETLISKDKSDESGAITDTEYTTRARLNLLVKVA
jgi:hypothetical protein